MPRSRTANLLGALAVELGERVEAQMKSHPNQTDTAPAALKLIGQFDGCSNQDLGRALKLTHPATVRLVDKLEAAGLVRRRPGADRRSVALSLTSAGHERSRALLDERSAVLEAVIANLSVEQCDQLDDIADTLLRRLVATPVDGAHVCRLCDEAGCPSASCPVHARVVWLMGDEGPRG